MGTRKRYCITELKIRLNDPSTTTYKVKMRDTWRKYSGPENDQDPYSLKRLKIAGPCEDQPCQNGGTCNDEIGTYSCDCSGTGYYGSNCNEVVDECKGNIDPSSPWNDRGKCKNNNGD